MPKNQTAWNSDNQGIKETVSQTCRREMMGKWADGENLGQRSRPCGWGWLREFPAKCWTLWEGLTERETETQSWLWTTAGVATVGETPSCTWEFIGKWGYGWAWAALFPLWPLPHRQHHSPARRVALPWWIPKAPSPYNLIGVLRQRNMAQMKE